jgi:hypothetical protein
MNSTLGSLQLNEELSDKDRKISVFDKKTTVIDSFPR